MNGQNGHAGSIRLACITANVGTVFEKMDTHFPLWLDAIMKQIQMSDVDILALHMQEIGGKSAGPKVNDLLLQFMPRLCCAMSDRAQFTRACIYADPDATNKCKYTALASCYFSRNDDCSIYNNLTKAYDQLLPLNAMRTVKDVLRAQEFARSHVYKVRFNAELAARPSFRKGYAHVTLKVDNRQIDLINMHLFHDESNIVALMQTTPSVSTLHTSSSELELPNTKCMKRKSSGVTMSAYAMRRRKTFAVALADCRLRIESRADSAQHLLFIFGDLNTRLRAGALIEQYNVDRQSELIATWDDAKANAQPKPGRVCKDPIMRTASASLADQLTTRNLSKRKASSVIDPPDSPPQSPNPTITMTNADSDQSDGGSNPDVYTDEANRNRSDSGRSDMGSDLITSNAQAPYSYSIVHKATRKELIFVGQKKFKLASDHTRWTLDNFVRWLDTGIEAELAIICAAEKLYECSITFAPTYPYLEEKSITENWSQYDSTRIPAWCDRVLFNESAKMALHTTVYTSIGQHECTGDHKPVFLLVAI